MMMIIIYNVLHTYKSINHAIEQQKKNQIEFAVLNESYHLFRFECIYLSNNMCVHWNIWYGFHCEFLRTRLSCKWHTLSQFQFLAKTFCTKLIMVKCRYTEYIKHFHFSYFKLKFDIFSVSINRFKNFCFVCLVFPNRAWIVVDIISTKNISSNALIILLIFHDKYQIVCECKQFSEI